MCVWSKRFVRILIRRAMTIVMMNYSLFENYGFMLVDDKAMLLASVLRLFSFIFTLHEST